MNPVVVGNPCDEKSSEPEEEKLLVHQEFLNDPSKTVAQVLEEEAIEIVDFVRYECGETSV